MDFDLALIIKSTILAYKDLTKDHRLLFGIILLLGSFMYLIHTLVTFKFIADEWGATHTVRDGTHKLAGLIFKVLVLGVLLIMWREL